MFWLRMKGCFCSLGFLSFYIYKKKLQWLFVALFPQGIFGKTGLIYNAICNRIEPAEAVGLILPSMGFLE